MKRIKLFEQFMSEAKGVIGLVSASGKEKVSIPKLIMDAINDAKKLQKEISDANEALKQLAIKMGNNKTVLMDYLKKIDKNSIEVKNVLVEIETSKGRTTYPYKEGKDMFQKALAAVNKDMADTLAKQFEAMKKLNPDSESLKITVKESEQLTEGVLADIGKWFTGWFTKLKTAVNSWSDSIADLKAAI